MSGFNRKFVEHLLALKEEKNGVNSSKVYA